MIQKMGNNTKKFSVFITRISEKEENVAEEILKKFSDKHEHRSKANKEKHCSRLLIRTHANKKTVKWHL